MSEWISVEDKLPIDGEKILIVYGDTCREYIAVGVMSMIRVSAAKDSKKVMRWYIFPSMGREVDDVTHWMPLPEPPS